MSEEKGGLDLGVSRQVGIRIYLFLQVVDRYEDVLVSSSGNRERPNKFNAHDIEMFIGSRYVVFKPWVGTSMAFSYKAGV